MKWIAEVINGWNVLQAQIWLSSWMTKVDMDGKSNWNNTQVPEFFKEYNCVFSQNKDKNRNVPNPPPKKNTFIDIVCIILGLSQW